MEGYITDLTYFKEFLEEVYPEIKLKENEPIIVPDDMVAIYSIWYREKGKGKDEGKRG